MTRVQRLLIFLSSIRQRYRIVVIPDDEVALLKAILTALRGIKIRDLDKALVILSKGDYRGRL